MGHTLYYYTDIERWEEFKGFLKRVSEGLGYVFFEKGESVFIRPECLSVEPLEIRKKGKGFTKTNLIEPCHSIYLLILHSVSSFGSISVWED